MPLSSHWPALRLENCANSFYFLCLFGKSGRCGVFPTFSRRCSPRRGISQHSKWASPVGAAANKTRRCGDLGNIHGIEFTGNVQKINETIVDGHHITTTTSSSSTSNGNNQLDEVGVAAAAAAHGVANQQPTVGFCLVVAQQQQQQREFC